MKDRLDKEIEDEVIVTKENIDESSSDSLNNTAGDNTEKKKRRKEKDVTSKVTNNEDIEIKEQKMYKELEDVLYKDEDTEETVKQEKNEEVPILELELEQVGNNVVVKHKTGHKFAPNEKVYVAEFCKVRDTQGFTKLVNSFRFYPQEGIIERVILTETPIKVQYKLKNKAGSLFDEEDVCHTIEEAQKLCEYKNRR